MSDHVLLHPPLQAPRVVDPHGRSYNRLVTAINQPALQSGSAKVEASARRSSEQLPQADFASVA